MYEVYEAFLRLPICHKLLCLEQGAAEEPYFCYPRNTRAIGYEGAILYCLIDGYGEMVFACNPESCAERYVYPLAKNFEDFVALILACGTVNPIEQMIWQSKSQFEEHLREEKKLRTSEQERILAFLERELGIQPMKNPYEYVKSVQQNFDDSKLEFCDEYYDVLGIER